MNDLQIIKGIECFTDESGMIQLNLEQVSRGLGFVDNSKSIEYVRWARVDKHLKEFNFATNGERPKYIPEPIFYLLAMKAENEGAKEFQKIVAYDVLPTIRKHGMYATEELINNPDLLIQVATELKKEREEKEKLKLTTRKQEQIINELKPKADYTDLILKNNGLVTITQIAKDYGFSGKAMNDKLHELKVQYKQSGQWLLYQSLQNNGYTHSETINIIRTGGVADISMITKWTQKGRLFLYDLLKQNYILPLIERE